MFSLLDYYLGRMPCAPNYAGGISHDGCCVQLLNDSGYVRQIVTTQNDLIAKLELQIAKLGDCVVALMENQKTLIDKIVACEEYGVETVEEISRICEHIGLEAAPHFIPVGAIDVAETPVGRPRPPTPVPFVRFQDPDAEEQTGPHRVDVGEPDSDGVSASGDDDIPPMIPLVRTDTEFIGGHSIPGGYSFTPNEAFRYATRESQI